MDDLIAQIMYILQERKHIFASKTVLREDEFCTALGSKLKLFVPIAWSRLPKLLGWLLSSRLAREDCMKSGIFSRNCFLIVMGLSLISPPAAIAKELPRAAEMGLHALIHLFFHDMKRERGIDCTRVADGCASMAPAGRLPNFTPAQMEAAKRSFPAN